MAPPEPRLFSSLPGGRFSPRALAASVALHCIILTLVICLPLTGIPEVQITIIRIVPPLVSPQFAQRDAALPKPPVIRAPLVFPNPDVPKPRVALKELRLPEPRPIPERKQVEAESRTPEAPQSPTPIQAPPITPVLPAPEVRVGVFSGSTSPDAVNRKPREPEAGGFGDRTGITRQGGVRGEVGAVGAFDAPAQAGARSGGSRNGRGLVVSGGFADNAAPGGVNKSPGAGDSGGSIQEGSFGDSHHPVDATKRRLQPVRPALLSAEILSKPKPAYTKEARDLGLEGEVVLEVLLAASGNVRVLRMIRGLGHGLDEAAVRAAEQIRFKPAERDGAPVDSRSVVQIIFRLS